MPKKTSGPQDSPLNVRDIRLCCRWGRAVRWLLILSTASAFAQTPDQAPQTGLLPSNTYTVDKLETIDRVNGNVMYHIPLASLPPVGPEKPFQLELINNSQNLRATYSWVSNPQLGPNGYMTQANLGGGGDGWAFNFNYSVYTQARSFAPGQTPACPYAGAYKQVQTFLLTPDGARHPLGIYGQSDDNGYFALDPTTGIQLSCNGSTTLSGPFTLFTADGTFLKVTITPATQSNPFSWVLSYPNGMTVTSNQLSNTLTMTDREGNATTVVCPNCAETTISNAAGQITITDNLNGSGELSSATITTAAFGGQAQTWTLNYTIQGAQGGAAYYTCNQLGNPCPVQFTASPFLTSINLPSPSGTPLTFQFGYSIANGWGNLNSVTYPSGLTVTYGYTDDGKAIGVGPEFLTNPVVSKVEQYNDVQDGGSTRRRSPWSFAYQTSLFYNDGACNTMTAPDNGVDTTCFIPMSGRSEFLTGQIVKQVSATGQIDEKELVASPVAFPFLYSSENYYSAMDVHTVTDSSETATESSVQTHVQDVNGNETSVQSYDWAPYTSITHSNGLVTGWTSGTLLRAESKKYNYEPANNAGADDSNAYWNPSSVALRNLLSSDQITGPNSPGALTQNMYDTKGNVTYRYRWNSNAVAAMPTALSAANAVVQSWTYSPHGNVLTATDARNTTTQYAYDANDLYLTGKVVAVNTPQQRTFSYVFDSSTGLLQSQTDVDNNIRTVYGYDLLNRVLSISEGNGMRNTSYGYEDAADQLRLIERQDLNSAGDGLLTTITCMDPLGRVRLTRELESASQSQSIDDDTVGIKVQTRYLYSGSNSYKLVSNPFRASTSSAAASEGTMGWQVTTYDQDNRTIGSETFAGSGLPAPWGGNTSNFGSVATAYSSQNTTVTDEMGMARTTAVDGLGRLNQVIEDPNTSALTTLYTYDIFGDLYTVVQNGQSCPSGGNPTQQTGCRYFAYDSLGHLGYTVQPETGATNYAYDANGNLTWKDNANGWETCYSYDALNRNTAKVYFSGTGVTNGQCQTITTLLPTPPVQYTYDTAVLGKGKLAQVSAQGVSTTSYLGYDALGRVTASVQATAGESYPFSYSYNLAGAMIGEVYPSGRIVGATYDPLNRLTQLSGWRQGNGLYVSGVSYAPQGAPAGYSYGNGLNRLLAYNGRLQPAEYTDYFTGQAACGGQGTLTNQSAYVLDLQMFWTGSAQQVGPNNGDLLNTLLQTCNGGGFGTAFNAYQGYTYDVLNRLQSFTDNGGGPNNQRNFFYDPYGNMWANNVAGTLPTEAGLPGSNVYPTLNRRSDMSYDGAGNQDQTPACPTAHCLTYDAENRLVSQASTTTGYAYDGEGRRVEKTANGVTTVYVYDVAGKLAAQYSSGSLATPDCNTCFLSADHLGTPRMITDQSGNLISRHDYLPFGDEIMAGDAGRPVTIGGANSPWNSADGINQKFTGKERDSESGLDYFGARYYGSALGRFTSPDVPLVDQFAEDPQSWNLYSYVRNNPLSNIDPNGEDCITTSNQSSSGVEVTTERGGSAGTCSGTFVDGTVNTNSYQYNGSNLTYSFANDTSSGAGNIQFGQSGSDDALSPFAAGVLSRAGAMAAPGVNLATQGLRMFGYAVAAPVMAAAECAAGAPSCTTGNVAMALLPELGALKAGGTILKVGAAAGKGAEIIQKAGGVAQAVKDFDALSGAESVNGAVRVKTFSDGSRAVLYTSSSTGQASIAIQEAGRTATKIRY